jgi:hypothetical protein
MLKPGLENHYQNKNWGIGRDGSFIGEPIPESMPCGVYLKEGRTSSENLSMPLVRSPGLETAMLNMKWVTPASM